MNTQTLAVELSIRPARVSAQTNLNIRGVVRNISTETLDTQLAASTLFVNGKLSETWSWAIANGLRDEREFALPTGEQIEFQRILPAASLLPTPGRYQLVLEVQGVRSPAVTIKRQ